MVKNYVEARFLPVDSLVLLFLCSPVFLFPCSPVLLFNGWRRERKGTSWYGVLHVLTCGRWVRRYRLNVILILRVNTVYQLALTCGR